MKPRGALEVILFLDRRFVGSQEFTEPLVTVGTAEGAMVRLDGADIAAEHAVVHFTGRTCVIEDQGTKAGTFCSGERVDSHLMQPNEEIAIGRYTLRFVIHQAQAAAAPIAVAPAPAPPKPEVPDLPVFAPAHKTEAPDLPVFAPAHKTEAPDLPVFAPAPKTEAPDLPVFAPAHKTEAPDLPVFAPAPKTEAPSPPSAPARHEDEEDDEDDHFVPSFSLLARLRDRDEIPPAATAVVLLLTVLIVIGTLLRFVDIRSEL